MIDKSNLTFGKEMVTDGHYPTSYALTAQQLFIGFPHRKYLSFTKGWPTENVQILCARVFKYFFYLMINDIIENLITFRFPPTTRAWLEMSPVYGDEFKAARRNGAFADVDFLASNFTGYNLQLRFNTRYGKWAKKIHVSKKYKDRITELTNLGLGW